MSTSEVGNKVSNHEATYVAPAIAAHEKVGKGGDSSDHPFQENKEGEMNDFPTVPQFLPVRHMVSASDPAMVRNSIPCNYELYS